MPRYYRRRYYPSYGRRTKYSNETRTINGVFEKKDFEIIGNYASTNWVDVVPATNTMGVRKVKNFKLNISTNMRDGTEDLPMSYQWVMVYVPEGQDAGKVETELGSLYEPNQNVIAQGTGISGQPSRSFTRLARNLNSGDRIMLCVIFNGYSDNWDTIVANIALHANFAIAY